MKQPLLTRTLLPLFLLCIINSCATLKLETPQVSLINIKPYTHQGMGFDIELNIANPNSIALPVSGISYQMKINGTSLLQGVSNQVSTIPAYGSVPVRISTSISILSAPKIFLNLMQNKNQKLSYELSTKIDLEGLLPSFRVVSKGELPESRAPL